MTQRELRNIIVKQLHTYLAGLKVVLPVPLVMFSFTAHRTASA